MSDTATCAKCGERRELCGSGRMDGVQQPRFCKECLIASMSSGDYDCRDELWFIQMVELGDLDSLKALGLPVKDGAA